MFYTVYSVTSYSWHTDTEWQRFIAFCTSQHHRHIGKCKRFVQHRTKKHENKLFSKLPMAYKWYKLFILCFPSIINPFQDLMEFFLLIWCTCITNAMFDVHENLKEDACNITAFLPPDDQAVKYKFIPGAKYGNKRPGKYPKKEIKDMLCRVSKEDLSVMGNKIFYL